MLPKSSNLHPRNITGRLSSDPISRIHFCKSSICQDFLEGGLQEGQTIKFTETEAEEEGVTGPPPTPMVGVAVVEGPPMQLLPPHMMRDRLTTTEL